MLNRNEIYILYNISHNSYLQNIQVMILTKITIVSKWQYAKYNYYICMYKQLFV